MSTLDDKLLGEKTHYYCSSSSEDEGDDEKARCGSKASASKFIPSRNLKEWEGSSTNTGPKGVIKDWQRYKQLETERREEQELERLALAKKLSLTCQTTTEEEEQRKKDEQLDAELQELFDDDKILEEFKQMHMLRMMEQHSMRSRFGTIFDIRSGEEYLDAVDQADKMVLVVVYIYNSTDKICTTMYECFHTLASDYPEVKFCCVEVSVAGLSHHFEKRGVPAILIYKSGNLMGNFIRVTDELGDEFVTSDVENFLLEHGMLPDHSLVLSSLRQSHSKNLD